MLNESSSGVIVGLDDGPQPHRTLMMAADEAERRGSRLAVVTVLQHLSDPDRSLPGQRRDRRRAEAIRLQHVHAAAVSLHPLYPRLPIATYCLGEAEVSPNREPLHAAELLVVGTRGQHAHQTQELGPLGRLLLINSRCPVLVVPDDLVTQSTAEPSAVARILVGVSNESADVPVVRAAYAEAIGRDREVLLLNAYSRRPGESAEAGEQRSQDLLARFAELAPTGVRVSLIAIEDDPAAALLRLAPDATLMVIGGRTGSAPGPVGGSVSRAVLTNVPCPVLAVPRDLVAGPPGPLAALAQVATDREAAASSLRAG